MKKTNQAIFYAVLAAALYALNAPVSKLLLNHIPSTMMAGLLYLGTGIGMYLMEKLRQNHEEQPLTQQELPYTVAMVVLDIAAPIFLMIGLTRCSAANASLLNNFEIVCTSLIALFVFKESVSKRMWIAISFITVSSFFLSFDDIATFTFSWGAILVLIATLCWGVENNCTRNLSAKNTYHIVFLKGIFSGLGALIVAICLRERFAKLPYLAMALLLGFVAYGLSIFFYIKAQGVIGAAKTSAYYAIAPFIGTFLSIFILDETIKWTYFVGLGIMIAGTIIVIIDTLAKKHNHLHRHTVTHTHDGSTHTHTFEHSQIEKESML